VPRLRLESNTCAPVSQKRDGLPIAKYGKDIPAGRGKNACGIYCSCSSAIFSDDLVCKKVTQLQKKKTSTT
jgi:hypothetical protein